MKKWEVVFRTCFNEFIGKDEVLACYREYNPYEGIQCIPLYKIDNTMIQECHCTLSPEYYYSSTKPLKDMGMIEEYKTHLEKWYNEEIQPMNKLIRRI